MPHNLQPEGLAGTPAVEECMSAGRAALSVSLQQVSLAGRPLMGQCLLQAGKKCSLKGTAESCSG